MQNPAQHSSLALPQWQLYGTVGCHLCELAQAILQQAHQVRDFELAYIDIAQLDDATMWAFSDKIPVLVTPMRTLYYPFSIMDVLSIED